MRNKITLIIFLFFIFAVDTSFAQVVTSKIIPDSAKNSFNLKERQALGFRTFANPFIKLPENIKKEVEYDPINKLYILTERIGDRLFSAPQYLTVEQYLRLVNSDIKRENWRILSNAEIAEVRKTGIIPPVQVRSRVFEKIFGGTTIDI
ncbi:MAG: hypothetical protein K2P75_08825, partial [Sphingobacteriaceae bacterium]|nr:hypothetical protein [Sphingobacteriaceae bacterium]